MKEFQLKKVIGNRGFYCTIKYEIEVFDKAYVRTKFDYDHKWYNAICFATEYFFEKYARTKPRGFRIVVHDVHDMIIDTTPMVVFYTMILLLTHETGYIVSDLSLNERGELILPK